MTTVRLLTWNIWGKNADWQAREDALLAALADVDADIVTVQEAWTEPSGSTQTARLAAALGFAHHHQADPPAADPRPRPRRPRPVAHHQSRHHRPDHRQRA